MSEFDVQLTNEHLSRTSKVKNYKALNEIIWNSIDADADNIYINLFFDNPIDKEKVTKISVTDDGIGLAIDKIESSLKSYGKSEKNLTNRTKKGRLFHGKLGEGRYTYFSLGSNIKWVSSYLCEKEINTFEINFEKNSIKVQYNVPKVGLSDHTGLKVIIESLNEETSYDFGNTTIIKENLIKEFAPYFMAYKEIRLYVNGEKIDFEASIIRSKDFSTKIDELEYKLKIIQWNNVNSNEIFYCGQGDVVYYFDCPNIFSNACSLYLESVQFDNMKISGEIELLSYDFLEERIRYFIKESYDLFSKENDVNLNNAFFDELKRQDVYPYVEEPSSFEEKEQKKIFDVVALQLNKVAPRINSANKVAKKLTYNLINEAIKTNPSSLKKVLNEVFKLSKEQLDDFARLLDETSMAAIISTMKEVTDRLYFLDELNRIVYEEPGKHVKERTQFQKLLLTQLWIFGDQYKYGTDDVSLRNVLKAYIKELEMTDIELTDEDYKNTDLNKIPDIVLWRNNLFGNLYENLVVEIKRPSKTLTSIEMEQIKKYAMFVAKDPRFAKNNCKWRFILIGKDLDDYVKMELSSHKNGIIVYPNDNYTVEIMSWGDLIINNKLKYNYFKEKSQITLSEEKVVDSLQKRWNDLLGDKAPKA